MKGSYDESNTTIVARWVWNISFFTGIIGNITLAIIWLIAAHPYPWFIYPIAVTIAFLSILHTGIQYLVARENTLFQCVTILFIDLNSMLLLTWILTFTPFPWPLWVLWATGAPYLIYYFIWVHWDVKLYLKLFYIDAWALYTPFAVVLLITEFATRSSYPWGIWVLMPLGAIPLAHAVYTYLNTPTVFFWIHFAIFSDFNLLFFFGWAVGSHFTNIFPWFIFIFFPWLGLLSAHFVYQYHRNNFAFMLHLVEYLVFSTFAIVISITTYAPMDKASTYYPAWLTLIIVLLGVLVWTILLSIHAFIWKRSNGYTFGDLKYASFWGTYENPMSNAPDVAQQGFNQNKSKKEFPNTSGSGGSGEDLSTPVVVVATTTNNGVSSSPSRQSVDYTLSSSGEEMTTVVSPCTTSSPSPSPYMEPSSNGKDLYYSTEDIYHS